MAKRGERQPLLPKEEATSHTRYVTSDVQTTPSYHRPGDSLEVVTGSIDGTVRPKLTPEISEKPVEGSPPPSRPVQVEDPDEDVQPRPNVQPPNLLFRNINTGYSLTDVIRTVKRELRQHCLYITIAISVILVCITLLIAPISTLSLSFSLQAPPSTFNADIGNKYQSTSALITIPNDVSSVSINTSSQITRAYATEHVPPNNSRIMVNSSRPWQNGQGFFNYNFYGNDNPLYLLPGSNITYDTGIETRSTLYGDNECLAQLFLFDNYTKYIHFLSNESPEYVDKSKCIQLGHLLNITFTITAPSVYYVAVSIGPNISISSTIIVHQVYYDTTGLLPAACQRTATSWECDRPGGEKICGGPDWYVIAQASSNIKVDYSYSKLLWNKCDRIPMIVAILVSFFLLSIAVPLVCFCLWKKFC